MLVITAMLLGLSLHSIQVGEGENKATFIWNAWQKSNKVYLALMAFSILISHSLRALRWQLLLAPTKNYIRFSNSFLSVMVGYLINLVVPRGGEVSRCYNLYKLEQTPAEISFGTVVVERIIDVLCLLVIIIISLISEWGKLQHFIMTLPLSRNSVFSPLIIIIALIGGIGVAVAAFYLLRKNQKIQKLFAGFKEGLLAVFHLQNKALFLFYSLGIWFLYFIMSYFVIKAFPETNQLGFSAVMTLFAIGAIAMAAPLPGGAGSYHVLVPQGLIYLYGLHQSDATAFVFIFHAWQTLVVIVVGLISLITSYILIRWKTPQLK